jgi:hypothetical protein
VVAGSLLSHAVPGGGHLLLLLIAVLLAFTAWRTAVTPPSDPASNEDEGGSNGEVEGGASSDGVGGVDDRGHPDAGSATLPLREASPQEGGFPRATDRPGTRDTDPPDAGAEPGRRGRRRWVAAGIGVVAGLLSGLLGIGGGVIMVPAFTELLGLPLKSAIATSLVCVGIFGVPATITHAVLGDIDWRLATLLTIGVIPGARIGASLTIRTAERRLRLAVGVFLALVALVYFVTETRALLEEL